MIGRNPLGHSLVCSSFVSILHSPWSIIRFSQQERSFETYFIEEWEVTTLNRLLKVASKNRNTSRGKASFPVGLLLPFIVEHIQNS
jgi:hypothetical protein